ncbi:MAG: carbamoyltransferase [Candidatus Thermochlorobacter sp.]
MKILGLSAFYHDSAAALIQDGRILAAAQEERFTRKKNDASFPAHAIQFCLDYAGTALDQLDAVVFYDKPLLKFERLLETYCAFAPKGLQSFIAAMPVWLREKMFLKSLLLKALAEVMPYDRKRLKLLFSEHHLSHAASAFYPSGFERAAILTVDGVGEWATASIALGEGRQITTLRELHFPHSLGLLYSAFTYFLGFKVNSGEYKLMGLAPYGQPHASETQRFEQLIKEHLVKIYDDGSIWLNQKYFTYATGLKMIDERAWTSLFGVPMRKAEDEPTQSQCNLALAIQRVTEEILLKMATEAKRLTQAEYLCLAGGVALNCVANGRLLNSGLFRDLFIQPAAGDAGGALGAALAAYHLYFEQERIVPQTLDAMNGAYLGPEYSELDIEKVIRKYDAVATYYSDIEQLCRDVATWLDEGKVVGWMQGRMEFGPRALGARSILADARNPEMQKKLNLKIKFREGFRPFAPSVLAERASLYFELYHDSPYMLLVQNVQRELRYSLPENYHDLPLKDKLYTQRSVLPAITHIDFSARIQTVHRETNPRYWLLLKMFEELTGCAVLLNTSFNVRGEPIICTPDDAYRCFMRTEMDMLVIGNYVFDKIDQSKAKAQALREEVFAPD